jgi:thiaminase/transcriptional activator TenA
VDWSQRLTRDNRLPSDPFYHQWIEIHAGDELAGFVAWMRRTLDSVPNPDIPQLRRTFRDTLRYEYLFFEMAYHGESWPG